MTKQSIMKLMEWMRRYGLKVDEHTFFQMAYLNVVGVAEPRCEDCFALYMKNGTVPLFVRQFIQKHFLAGGLP